MIRTGARAAYLGPVTGRTADGIEVLVVALLEAAGERAVIWDVPDSNPSARGMADQLGFRVIRPLTRMRLGGPGVNDHPPAQFAIADPSIG
jgi:hypothetical protein